MLYKLEMVEEWAALLASCALAQQQGPYGPDPNLIWNRVHRVLHVRVAGDGREYGSDELDPLLSAAR